MMATTPPSCLCPPTDPPSSPCMDAPLEALCPVIPPEPPAPPYGHLLLILQTVLYSVVSPSSFAVVIHLTLLPGAALLCTSEITGYTQSELWVARSVRFCIGSASLKHLHSSTQPHVLPSMTRIRSATRQPCSSLQCTQAFAVSAADPNFRSTHFDGVCTFMSSLTESEGIPGLSCFPTQSSEINIVSSGSFAETETIAIPSEAVAMRSALYMARTLGLQLLKVFSDNSTLIRAISGNSQSKEITGIVFDIRSISSDFATIVFYISRSENVIAENLAKQALRAFSSLY
ncbi:unnamed protein product [Brassica oleracea]